MGRGLRQFRQSCRRGRRPPPPLLFFTDQARVPDCAAAIAALPPGCGVVLRDYRRRNRKTWAKRMIDLCRAQDRLVLVAGDPRAALAWGADGVHLPTWALDRPAGRRPKAQWIVTAAVHNRAELVQAQRAGADWLILSPVFATESHPGGKALGPLRLGLLARGATAPVIALGGIGPGNAKRLQSLPLSGHGAIESLLKN